MSRYDMMEKMRDDEIRKREHSVTPEIDTEHSRPASQTPAAEALAREIEPIMQAIATLSAATAQDIAKVAAQCQEMRNSTVQMLAKMGEGMKLARDNAMDSAKAAKQNQLEAQTSGALVLEASRLMQEHTQKTRVLVDVWRWIYPLAAAILVSLLWAALLLWRLPDYENITQYQSQIWQKLEAMDAIRKEPPKK